MERWGRPGWGDLIGRTPTDRGKRGVKRRLVVEASGGPQAVVIAGATGHDPTLLAATQEAVLREAVLREAVLRERPQPTREHPQHPQPRCLDTAYDHPTGHRTVEASGYVPHLRRIGEEQFDPPSGETRCPARRWGGERTLAGLCKCRAVLVRDAKYAATFLGRLKLACALVGYRRRQRLSLVREVGTAPAPLRR